MYFFLVVVLVDFSIAVFLYSLVWNRPRITNQVWFLELHQDSELHGCVLMQQTMFRPQYTEVVPRHNLVCLQEKLKERFFHFLWVRYHFNCNYEQQGFFYQNYYTSYGTLYDMYSCHPFSHLYLMYLSVIPIHMCQILFFLDTKMSDTVSLYLFTSHNS